jgi:hypothetical protein
MHSQQNIKFWNILKCRGFRFQFKEKEGEELLAMWFQENQGIPGNKKALLLGQIYYNIISDTRKLFIWDIRVIFKYFYGLGPTALGIS